MAGGSAAKAVRLEDREGLVREVRTRLIEANLKMFSWLSLAWEERKVGLFGSGLGD